MLGALQQGKPVADYWVGEPPSELRGEVTSFTLVAQTPRATYETERLTALLKMKRETLPTIERSVATRTPSWVTDADTAWILASIRADEQALAHANVPGQVYSYKLKRPLKPDETWAFVTNDAGQIVRADDLSFGHVDRDSVRLGSLLTRIIDSLQQK